MFIVRCVDINLHVMFSFVFLFASIKHMKVFSVKREHSSTLGIIMDKLKMQLNRADMQRNNRLQSCSDMDSHTLYMPADRQAVFIYCLHSETFATIMNRDKFAHGTARTWHHFFLWLAF